MKQFHKAQQGFTLLELLVVITLLAVLAVGALVAYEGVGDQAGAAAAANNAATVDRAVRNYRAVTKAYPNQWDNLSAFDSANGFDEDLMAAPTLAAFASINAAGNAALQTAINAAFAAVGINQLQAMNADQTIAGVAPNLQHNEGANVNADEEAVAGGFLSIMPSHNGTGACTFETETQAIFGTNAAPTTVAANERLNQINDHLEVAECHLVVALGFGHDAAHSTIDKSVAIAQAPTYTSKNVNPANHYGRYVALFHLGTAESGVNVTEDDIEEHGNPTLIAVVDTEGNPIDVNLLAANKNN